MRGLLIQVDDLLRGRILPRHGPPSRPGARVPEPAILLTFIIVFGLGYGAVMGAFGGVTGERLLQVLYSAVKVPLLLLVTFLVSLPSFFILNTLMGLRDDFPHAIRALAATQAGLTIILCSFAPFTALWYASWPDYTSAILFNAVMFGLASLCAQLLLRRFYAPLIARDRRHRLLLIAWLIVYAFVGIQFGWVLRPFIGDPSIPTEFFREESWSNAYLHIFRMIMRKVG